MYLCIAELNIDTLINHSNLNNVVVALRLFILYARVAGSISTHLKTQFNFPKFKCAFLIYLRSHCQHWRYGILCLSFFDRLPKHSYSRPVRPGSGITICRIPERSGAASVIRRTAGVPQQALRPRLPRPWTR